MKKFLFATFKTSLFQIVFILLFVGIKYLFTNYKLIDKIEKPLVWFCLGAGVIFVLALSVIGFIENSGKTIEEWKSNPKKTRIEKFMANFASWGFAIPSVLGFIILIYIITPTSILMFIALYAGIVFRNCILFFSEKQTQEAISKE